VKFKKKNVCLKKVCIGYTDRRVKLWSYAKYCSAVVPADSHMPGHLANLNVCLELATMLCVTLYFPSLITVRATKVICGFSALKCFITLIRIYRIFFFFFFLNNDEKDLNWLYFIGSIVQFSLLFAIWDHFSFDVKYYVIWSVLMLCTFSHSSFYTFVELPIRVKKRRKKKMQSTYWRW